MFLARPIRSASSAATAPADNGSALLTVIGVMGVAGILALTIATISLSSLGNTSAARARVQSQAAAEAGIDFAAAQLANSVCQTQFSSTTAPIFTVTISYSTVETPSTTTDTSWVSGCSTATSVKRVRFISTGTATSSGVAGNSAGNVRRVEAIFPYTRPSAILPTGPTIYAFLQSTAAFGALTTTQGSTTKPFIQVLSGNTSCAAGTNITAAISLKSGAFSTSSTCIINGDVRVSSTISNASGTITGNLFAAGVVSGVSVTLSSATASIVNGNINGAGPVSIRGQVTGNIVAGPTTGTSSILKGTLVTGSATFAGTYSGPGQINGAILINQSGIVAPTIPVVPGWIDFAYQASNWSDANGNPFAINTLSSCAQLSTALTSAATSSTATIFDSRVCGAITNLQGINLNLQSDLVIIGNGFQLGTSSVTSANGLSKRLWFITPDATADAAPTCPTGGTVSFANKVTMDANITSLLYSPCVVSLTANAAGSVWRGQFYAASITFGPTFTLDFVPVGVPGYDLTTGLAQPGSTTFTLGNRTAIRNVRVG